MLSHAEYDIEADVETRAPYSPDYSYSSDDPEHETTSSVPSGLVPVHLYIKTFDKTRNLFGLTMLSSLHTIAMLRMHPAMLERFGENASSVKLVYGGKTLEDTQTLEDTKVPGREGTIHAFARSVQAGIRPTASGGSSSSNKGKRKVEVTTKCAMTTTPVQIFIKAENGLVDRLIKLEMDSLMDKIEKVRTHHKLICYLQDWAFRCQFTFQGRILKEDDTLADIGVAINGSSWIYAVP